MRKSLYLIFVLLVFGICNAFAQPGGNALKFDGVDDYISILHSDLLNVNAVTIEMWFYWDNATIPSDVDFLIGKGTENLEIHTGGGSGNHALRFIPTTSVYIDTDENAFESNKWNHVACVYDPALSVYAVYINGTPVATHLRGGNPITTPIISTPAEALKLGIRQGGVMSLEGKLDEVRIWNDVRTEAEIKENMNRELAGTEAGLVAYYKMNSNAGTTVEDATANDIDGSFISSPVWQTSGCFASARKCLDFDGTDDCVTCTNSPSLQFNGRASFSLEAWIKPVGGVWCALVSKFVHTASVEGYSLEIFSDNRISLLFGNNWSDWTALTSSIAVSTGVWHHVAATYDGTTVALYIDGVMTACTTWTNGITDSNTPLLIASRSGTTFNLGQIDEVRVWNTARTVSELRENMCKTLSGNESGLAAYYRLDENDGTAVYDLTSNANNGTLTNMDAATDRVASSAFNTWIGAESSDMTFAGNWGGSHTPLATEGIGIYKWALGNNLTFSGNPTVQSLLISSSAAPTMGANMTVNGNLLLEKNLDLSGSIISLGTSASLVEGSGKFFGTSGLITTTRYLSSNLIALDVAGLGAKITTVSALGNTTVSREYNSSYSTGSMIFGHRFYNFNPTNNSGLNATLVFNYTDSDLNGLDEGTLRLFSSTNNGASWTRHVGTINAANNNVTLTGINSFAKIGMSDANRQAINLNFSNITRTGMTVRWTRGSGDSCLLLVSENYRIPSSCLVDNTTYRNSSSSYSDVLNSSIGAAKVIYKGNSATPSIAVTNLTKYKLYYFKACEYNNNAGDEYYNQTENATNPRSRWTLRKEGEAGNNEALLNIYPNPAKDYLNYTLPLSDNSTVVSEVYSSDGRLIKSINHGDYSEGEKAFNISVNDLPNGVYLLRINTGADELVGIFEVIR